MIKISILMPIFNEQKYIVQAIDSVLEQSCEEFELIIVDDFSTDNSYNICKEYSNKFDRIKLIRNKKKGKVSAFNTAYKKSSGDFICYFAGDDMMTSDSLKNRFNFIFSNLDSSSSCISRVKMISSINKFNDIELPKNKQKGTLLGGCVMFDQSLGNKIFPIPEDLPNEDKWTALHMTYFSNIIHVPYISLLYRIHSKNSSSRTKNFNIKNIEMHDRFLVYKLFLDTYQSRLTHSVNSFLKSMIYAEELRYNNKTLSLFFIRIPIKEKIRFIFHSNKFLYWIRIKLFSVFSGWGN